MTYTDEYPSGRPYLACGAAHPSGELVRRCSRHAEHPGRHVNRFGNEWEDPAMANTDTGELGAPGVRIRTRATCPECGRRFDLTDETDATEWYGGHDCEDAE
jgi:hypothetical protein